MFLTTRTWTLDTWSSLCMLKTCILYNMSLVPEQALQQMKLVKAANIVYLKLNNRSHTIKNDLRNDLT
jgi:hypothetical protein